MSFLSCGLCKMPDSGSHLVNKNARKNARHKKVLYIGLSQNFSVCLRSFRCI